MNHKAISAITLILFFQFFSFASAETNQQIEVYDIEKQEIVQKIPSTESLQKEIQAYLQSIKRTIPPLDEAPKMGKMIRIPIHPHLKLQNEWVNTTVHEVFLILIPSHNPFIILYDAERKPYLLQSDYPLELLKEKING